jgi:hypothetical protein
MKSILFIITLVYLGTNPVYAQEIAPQDAEVTLDDMQQQVEFQPITDTDPEIQNIRNLEDTEIVLQQDSQKIVDEFSQSADNQTKVLAEQYDGSMDGAILAFLGFASLAWILVTIGGFIFWISMLVRVIKYDSENKVLWILIIIFGNVIGAIIYYFVEGKQVKKNWDIQQAKSREYQESGKQNQTEKKDSAVNADDSVTTEANSL